MIFSRTTVFSYFKSRGSGHIGNTRTLYGKFPSPLRIDGVLRHEYARAGACS